MADFSVPVNIPDGKVTELVAALQWHWGPASDDGQGNVVQYTPAQLRAKLKESVENSLKDIFTRHKQHLRAQAEIDDTLEVS